MPRAISPISSRVKDALKKKGTYDARVDDGQLHLMYQRGTFSRETIISTSTSAKLDQRGLTFKVHIDPHGEWTTTVDVATGLMGPGGEFRVQVKDKQARKRARQSMEQNLDKWLAEAPRVECDWEPLQSTYRRSLIDLAALRYSPSIAKGQSLPAAGLPWFMTMFGRDSIFTSLQAVPFTPELAATTLRVLGAWQGSRVDDFRDEDPGRILHEMRYGEMTAFEERPHSPYYGCADATSLYVILLDEYERWTGDTKLVRELEFEARSALRWIDVYADLMGNGYAPTSAGMKRPALKISAGRTRGIPSLSMTAHCPDSRAQPANCRGTPMTPNSGGRGWRVSFGRTRHLPRNSKAMLRTSSGASTGISGSKMVSSTPWPWIPKENRSTRSRRTMATCSGAASSTRRKRKPSRTT